jgi:hypothetical protein
MGLKNGGPEMIKMNEGNGGNGGNGGKMKGIIYI